MHHAASAARSGMIGLLLCMLPAALSSQSKSALIPVGESELRDSVSLFTTDRGALSRRWTVEYSADRRERFREFYTDWRARLGRIAFDKLSQEGRIDYVLLDHRLRSELAKLAREEKLAGEMASLVPFAARITAFEEARRRFDPVDGPLAGKTLSTLATEADSLTKLVRAKKADSATRAERIVALRAVSFVGDLQTGLRNWYRFYAGYDPALHLVGERPVSPRERVAHEIHQGAARGDRRVQREGQDEPDHRRSDRRATGFAEDLDAEMIPYTPEELIAIAEREFAWCEAEMKKAAREMGFGDDWKAALEKVKNTVRRAGPAAGADPRPRARGRSSSFEKRDLVTVPPLARRSLAHGDDVAASASR